MQEGIELALLEQYQLVSYHYHWDVTWVEKSSKKKEISSYPSKIIVSINELD